MANLNARNLPDTVAEGFAELAREHGMSREAYLRQLITEAVDESGYRKLANDPEYSAYQEARRAGRAGRAARREARDEDVA